MEVTPSDLLMGGGEAVERWARIVFEALSLLTRVVILFDEFDPVLSKRKTTGDRPISIFAFLTASMLPKLKTLYKTAGTRSVAYVLITNLIDSLDEPTVRKGRFNEKLGIYPPDVLSRAGRFLSEAVVMDKVTEMYLSKDPTIDELKARLEHILKISCGAGMEGLNQEGWFRRPDNKEPTKGTPLHYYIYGRDKPEKLEPDAHLKEISGGEGLDAQREYQEWAWVEKWDKEFTSKGFQALEEAPDKLPEPPNPPFAGGGGLSA